ncbi:MAG TPA: transglutaminase-like domain-containing protein [Patescibacteria group bacterium]|nr:transglutaminase-like domain-containing protein [Patescibacteria group bacterium]
MKINKLVIIAIIVSSFSFFASPTKAASLSGRILLQVQDNGEAWYVNPLNNERYYLGRPDDAFTIMRTFGLGVSTNNINSFLFSSAPVRLSGRILLQVEDKGQAYYVNPVNLKLYYLGRPTDAFQVMRNLGLGITNSDLSKIIVSANSTAVKIVDPESIINYSGPSELGDLVVKNFNFKFNNESQSLSLSLSPSLFEVYENSPKVYTYPVNSPPVSLQESFYSMFLKVNEKDNSLGEIIGDLEQIAITENLSQDELAELALAFVQYIPYDTNKAAQLKISPYYPYETLYLNKGVCSDKTFLAYLILQKLGYGVAILDFPDINHSTIGIACEKEYSLNYSGYCYAETTNYFPISVIPQNISSGQADTSAYNFSEMFTEDKLGSIEIYNEVDGNLYLKADEVRSQANEMEVLYDIINNERPLPSASYYEIIEYNKKVELFNTLLNSFYQK